MRYVRMSKRYSERAASMGARHFESILIFSQRVVRMIDEAL